MSASGLTLLECTLRDGAYAIDFQFTARDTALIASALEQAGVRTIEIGHGLGLNAAAAGRGDAAASDEAYLEAAAGALSQARWGVFYIPGIGRLEDLDRAARRGVRFVRIGTNATEVDQAREAIARARALDLLVTSNLMKSYALPVEELVAAARRAEEMGADVVYLVDSAGTMLPRDVERYVSALRKALGCAVGFHGHENLRLGVANSLAAVEAGATWVDSALQGMGRSAGNPATEILVAVLERAGHPLNIDLNRVMDAGHRLVKPLLRDRGIDGMDVAAGYAGFHSSYLSTILRHARKHDVDPRDLIIAVCEQDQVNADDDLVEMLARRLRERPRPPHSIAVTSIPRFAFTERGAQGAADLHSAAGGLARETRAAARKLGKQAVLNIVATVEPEGRTTLSRFVQEEFDFIIGSVEIDDDAHLAPIVEAADGIVDVLLVDGGLKPHMAAPLAPAAAAAAHASAVVIYDDAAVWVRTVEQQLDVFLRGLAGRRIVLFGVDPLTLRLAVSLCQQGVHCRLTGAPAPDLAAAAVAIAQLTQARTTPETEADPVRAAGDAAAIVSFARHAPAIDGLVIAALASDTLVLDAGIGALTPEALERGLGAGLSILRPDMRAALAAELASRLGGRRIVTEMMGRGAIDGVSVVAGGLVGRRGEVVVDSLSQPTRVVGVADGRGRVQHDPGPEHVEAVRAVEAAIFRRRSRPD